MSDAREVSRHERSVEPGKRFDDLISALRFLQRFRRHLARALAICLCGTVSSALQLLVPLSSLIIINEALPNKDLKLLGLVALGLAITTLASLLTGYGETYLGTALRERLSLELQRDVFEHLQRLPFSFFKKNNTGYMMGRVLTDTQTAVDFPTGLPTLGRSLIWLGTAFFLVPAIHPIIGVAIAVTIPLYAALLVVFNQRIKERFAIVQEQTALTSRNLFEALTGIYETKAFTQEKSRVRRFFHIAAAKARSQVLGRNLMILAGHSTQIIMLIVTLFILTYGGSEVIRDRLTLGELVTLSALVGYLLLPVNGLVQQVFEMQRSVAAIERLNEVLDVDSETYPGIRPKGKAIGHIQFSGVSFQYEPDQPVLSRIDFEVNPGETVLFVGPSGQGKSSLMALLPRFYTPHEGSIFLDGVPIENLDLIWLRHQIAFVSQDTFLFSDTVLNNLRVGSAQASREEIVDAARRANALSFIEQLPNGFETVVGERGCRLSGGQRQRIAIARALLREAPILVLDEATSAVDRETENEVYEALGRLMVGKTTLVVAHHWEAFLHHVDRSFEVRDGKVKATTLSSRLAPLEAHSA